MSLFDDLPGRGPKPARERPFARGACPHCSAERVGLALSNDGEHLSWMMHDLITHAGTKLPCGSTGLRVCDYPARKIEGYSAPVCPHDRARRWLE